MKLGYDLSSENAQWLLRKHGIKEKKEVKPEPKPLTKEKEQYIKALLQPTPLTDSKKLEVLQEQYNNLEIALTELQETSQNTQEIVDNIEQTKMPDIDRMNRALDLAIGTELWKRDLLRRIEVEVRDEKVRQGITIIKTEDTILKPEEKNGKGRVVVWRNKNLIPKAKKSSPKEVLK